MISQWSINIEHDQSQLNSLDCSHMQVMWKVTDTYVTFNVEIVSVLRSQNRRSEWMKSVLRGGRLSLMNENGYC